MSDTNDAAKTAKCPVDVCGNDVDVEGLQIGRPVICPHCGSSLRVTSMNPPALTQA